MKGLLKIFAGCLTWFLLHSGLSAQDCSADFTVSIDGPTATFDGTATGDMPYYSWSFGDGSTSTEEDPVHTYMYDGVYTACFYVLAADSCVATYCNSVEISGAGGIDSTSCAAYFYYSVDAGMVSFTNASELGGAGTAFYFWDLGDGTTSTVEDPTHYYAPGWYTVCLDIITADSCTSSYCMDIYTGGIIDSMDCTASFYYYVDGMTADFTNASDPGVGMITAYSWNFGDGGTAYAEDPTHTYTSTGTYNVCLTIFTSDSCTSTYCTSVFITDGTDTTGIYCNAEFTFVFGATSNSIITTNISDPGMDPSPAYSWDFGDGGTSTAFAPEHTFAADGSYNVCLTIFTDSCTDTYCSVVEVTILGFEELRENKVNIYPNPASDVIYVQTGLTGNFDLSIADLEGRIVQEEHIQSITAENITISIARLQAGLYILRLKDAQGGSVSKKIQILR